jgi:SAM-dependent methyltransferase
MTRADKATDVSYRDLRARHSTNDARANGYRFHKYFLREQKYVLELIGPQAGAVLDVGCGSGLLLAPLAAERANIFGLDFNEIACRDAVQNGLKIIRGDGFALPVGDGTVHTVVATQFINQQTPEATRRFLREAVRVLETNGRTILVWRNGKAWIHRAAHTLYSVGDSLLRRPKFPYINHQIGEVCGWANKAGLRTELSQSLLSVAGLKFDNPNGIGSKILGASFVAVFSKPG